MEKKCIVGTKWILRSGQCNRESISAELVVSLQNLDAVLKKQEA
jgi:hypothetical protein